MTPLLQFSFIFCYLTDHFLDRRNPRTTKTTTRGHLKTRRLAQTRRKATGTKNGGCMGIVRGNYLQYNIISSYFRLVKCQIPEILGDVFLGCASVMWVIFPMVAPGNDEFAGNPNAVWIIWTIYYIFIEKIVNPHINFLTYRPRTVFQHHATFAAFAKSVSQEFVLRVLSLLSSLSAVPPSSERQHDVANGSTA